jgi:hypothetical protein
MSEIAINGYLQELEQIKHRGGTKNESSISIAFHKLLSTYAKHKDLEQYKEKKLKDPTIAKLFNTYRFTDYKDKVIDLLCRVTTVSVKTMEIVGEMK